MPGEKRLLMVAGTPILAGGERNLLDLTTYVLDRGFEVGLIAPGEGELPRRIRSLGCPVWEASMPKMLNPRSVWKIRKVVKEEGFEIVHAHGHLAGLYARTAALGLHDARSVYTLHGIHYPHYHSVLKRTAFIIGERVLKRSTDHFICVCKSDLETGRSLRIIDPESTDVIYNGIDPDAGVDAYKAAELRNRYNRGGGIVLHAGRFMPQKDHYTLIASIPQVLEESPRTVFLLAGSGRLLQREKEHAVNLGIPGESLVFLGESGEVDNLLAICDIFVLPSLWEGFPYVILEAMRAAKPVVVTDSGGTPEAVVHGDTGFVIKPGDPGSLAIAVKDLLRNPEEAAAMGRRGRERLKDFSLESMARKTLEVYDRVLYSRPEAQTA
ncbi:MAG: glycosyltransferase family 4 protein [Actinobacteria bacterium]|nr:glycosyltransferase family 4 protein [Actinomycetota bacterium]